MTLNRIGNRSFSLLLLAPALLLLAFTVLYPLARGIYLSFQSYSLVDFLITTYGEDKFAALLHAFGGGASTTSALEEVYGFNQDGLENAWRESVGLPPRSAPTPVTQREDAQPTGEPDTSGASDDGGGDSQTFLIVAILALTAGLAVSIVGAGVLLARRFR